MPVLLPDPKRKSNLLTAVSGVVGAGTLAAGVAGAVYGAAAWYLPVALVSVALCIGAACVTGWFVARAAIARVVPSGFLVLLMGLAAGAIALYAAWGANAAARIPGAGFQALSPRFLAAFAHNLYHFGGITVEGDMGDTTYKGAGLVVLWVVEAICIVGGTGLVSILLFQSQRPPLCSDCNTWKTTEHGIVRCGVPEDLQGFVDSLGSGSTGWLNGLPEGSIDDDPHLRIDLTWCPSCNRGAAVSASLISYTSNPSEVCICGHAELPDPALAEVLSRAAETVAPEQDGELSAETANAPDIGDEPDGSTEEPPAG